MKSFKNTTHEVTIVDLTHDGAGVAKLFGYPVFVPGTVVGEQIRVKIITVKSRYMIGKNLAILTPSSDRVIPPCPVYGQCGGCQLQHMSMHAQARWKSALVVNQIQRIGKSDVLVSPIRTGDSLRYRHKAIIPFVEKDGKILLGFYAPHSHRVVPISDCLIQAMPFAEIMQTTLSCMQDTGLLAYNDSSHAGVLRALMIRHTSTGQILVGLSLNAQKEAVLFLAEKWKKALKGLPITGGFFSYTTAQTNVPFSGPTESVFGISYLEEIIGSVRLQFGPNSFFQVNPAQAVEIINYIRPYVQNAVLWDLYAGVGTLGLAVADVLKALCCLEVVPEAARFCKTNADLNNIPISVIQGALETSLDVLANWPDPDVILLDPPRQGCHPTVIRFLCNDVAPTRLIYVSCDPATFARDLQALSLVYRCVKVQPIDMFPMTRHVEVVGIFERICND